ncbi:hypothetical protein NLJ89_g11119 [Agrocybe chaxingu]|uniref:Uncharacterized protein n=1 Tax=Agrocybe chaxingu TaxID=84603 RepID=A0A9W8JQJ5_9AGAR|nr:hypothetical protein NLJ89_g11119 [Agrocybe chaxingu]
MNPRTFHSRTIPATYPLTFRVSPPKTRHQPQPSQIPVVVIGGVGGLLKFFQQPGPILALSLPPLTRFDRGRSTYLHLLYSTLLPGGSPHSNRFSRPLRPVRTLDPPSLPSILEPEAGNALLYWGGSRRHLRLASLHDVQIFALDSWRWVGTWFMPSS